MPWTLQWRSEGSEGGGGGVSKINKQINKKLIMTALVNYSLKRQCLIYVMKRKKLYHKQDRRIALFRCTSIHRG